jgi:hypothetical protein
MPDVKAARTAKPRILRIMAGVYAMKVVRRPPTTGVVVGSATANGFPKSEIP